MSNYFQNVFGARAKRPTVVKQSLGAPIAADPDRIVTSVNLANAVQAIAAQPDVPRNVTVTVTDTTASITQGTVTVTGTGTDGELIVETFDFSSFTSGTPKVGTKIFANVATVETSNFATLGGGGDETLTVGVGNVIGFPNSVQSTSALKLTFLGGAIQTGPIVSSGYQTSGVNASGGTYDGSKELVIYYKPTH